MCCSPTSGEPEIWTAGSLQRLHERQTRTASSLHVRLCRRAGGGCPRRDRVPRLAPNCLGFCRAAVVPRPSSRRHRLGVAGRNCGLRFAWDAPSRGRSAVAPNSSLPSPPRKPRNWRRFAPGPVSAALRLNRELRSFRIRNRRCLLHFPKTSPSTTPNQPKRQRIIF